MTLVNGCFYLGMIGAYDSERNKARYISHFVMV